jgi:hypothetical protein
VYNYNISVLCLRLDLSEISYHSYSTLRSLTYILSSMSEWSGAGRVPPRAAGRQPAGGGTSHAIRAP